MHPLEQEGCLEVLHMHYCGSHRCHTAASRVSQSPLSDCVTC